MDKKKPGEVSITHITDINLLITKMTLLSGRKIKKGYLFGS
jgi:hypothetical protein